MPNKYTSILFVQGEQAEEFLEMFEDYSGDEFLCTCLETADPYGDASFEESSEEPWGSRDTLYRMQYDGNLYVVGINWGLPYLSLTKVSTC